MLRKFFPREPFGFDFIPNFLDKKDFFYIFIFLISLIRIGENVYFEIG
jgi:hypothetical protein